MSPPTSEYSLADLTALTGVSPRTVRFYISQGLLPRPEGAGPGTRYSATHVARIRLIRRLQAQHLPLAEIRRRLETLGDEDVDRALQMPETRATGTALDYVRALLGEPGPSQATPRAPAPPPALAEPAAASSEPPPRHPASPDRSQWERIALAPDVELHVRRPLSRSVNRQVDRIVTIARELLEEEGS